MDAWMDAHQELRLLLVVVVKWIHLLFPISLLFAVFLASPESGGLLTLFRSSGALLWMYSSALASSLIWHRVSGS